MNKLNHQDVVTLVHGLGGNRFDMWPISRRLKRSGYRICNWGYRSVGNRIETHADRLATEMARLDAGMQDGGRIHLVTHSMGGIIVRKMLSHHDFENIGRVIMLAPPHQGSHAARKLKGYIGWLTPSLSQLSDSADSFVNQLPNSLQHNGIEFAIIESTKDRVIVQGGVHLDGYRDYARVEGHHGVLTWYSKTIRLVEDFLQHGKFQPAREQGDQNVCQDRPGNANLV